MKKILMLASEAVPFIKTGGLADVAGSLPKYMDKQYFDCRVMLPKYQCMKEELKAKLEYITHFYMKYLGEDRYVGILKAEHEGITYYFIDNENFERCSEVYKDLDKLGNGRYTTTQVGRWGRREGQDVVCEINDELRYVGSGVSELVFVDPKLVTKIAVEEFADDAFVNSLKKNLREVAHHMAVCFTDSATAEDAEKKFADARIMMSRIKNYIYEMVDVAKTRAAQAAKEKEERERLEKEKQEQEAERKKIDVAAQQFEEEIDRLFGDDEKDEIYDEDSPVV